MTTIVLDIALFRQQFPAFADGTAYPDSTLQLYWDMAVCYISDEDYGCLSGSCRQLALNYMTSHLLLLNDKIQNGENPSYSVSASIDKISVTNTQPPATSQWQWWLSTTPYGMQLWALLSQCATGGFYIGGLPETLPYRKVGGVY